MDARLSLGLRPHSQLPDSNAVKRGGLNCSAQLQLQQSLLDAQHALQQPGCGLAQLLCRSWWTMTCARGQLSVSAMPQLLSHAAAVI